MIRNVRIEDIKKYPRLFDVLKRNGSNTESELYLQDGEVYKILDENVREQNAKMVLESNMHYLKGLVKSNDILLNNGNFIGYTMPLIQDLTLKELIGTFSFEKKFWLLRKIVSIFWILYSNGFVYQDFHTSNIIVGKSGLLFLDRDGMFFNHDLREGDASWIINFFWGIVLSLLYDEDFSLNCKAIETMDMLGIKNIFYDIRFFEPNRILNILGFLEGKKEAFYHESKAEVRQLIL